MSSNREYGKEKRSRKNKKSRSNVDYEVSRHIQHKVKKLTSKDRNEKYRRFDAEEDFYS